MHRRSSPAPSSSKPALFTERHVLPTIVRGLDPDEAHRRSRRVLDDVRATLVAAEAAHESRSARIEYCAYHGVAYEDATAYLGVVEALLRLFHQR